MIARLLVGLPFNIAIPEGKQFQLYSYEDEGYQIVEFPPARTDRPVAGDTPAIKMNGADAFLANGLRIDFIKDHFDRVQGSPWDPPETVLRRAADTFVSHLRFRTRGTHVRPLPWPHVPWRLQYLNDDGSELQEQGGLIRARTAVGLNWSWVALDSKIWDDMHQVPTDHSPPIWDELRLDARAALPHVGTAVVLGSACLEVFVAAMLDQLATRGAAPPDLWNWINHRSDWLKRPSVDEQFDSLLRQLLGHSLKEDSGLWESFKNLRGARNSFVHEGVAMIGGRALTASDVGRLLDRVDGVIAWTRQWLPDELKWPEFEPHVRFTIEQEILRPNLPPKPMSGTESS